MPCMCNMWNIFSEIWFLVSIDFIGDWTLETNTSVTLFVRVMLTWGGCVICICLRCVYLNGQCSQAFQKIVGCSWDVLYVFWIRPHILLWDTKRIVSYCAVEIFKVACTNKNRLSLLLFLHNILLMTTGKDLSHRQRKVRKLWGGEKRGGTTFGSKVNEEGPKKEHQVNVSLT